MSGFLASPAGAATLTSPDGITALNTVTTQGTVTPGTPYASGQFVNVVVAANSTISAAALATAGVSTSGNYYVEECADPNGAPPASVIAGPTNCEASTINASATRSSTSDGHLTLSLAHAFKIYDLPDANLPAGTMTGTCDVAPNTCVLGIFVANPNIGTSAFTDPHLFSAPFQVTANLDGTDNPASPGDGTPEVPLVLGLPLAAAAVIGGATLYGRRRRHRTAA